ncbi:MAG TPA: hypothetical protein VKB50_31175 [Vicinamibacterales bacterium]|nr:hypothetical protein [Vicinamibacterales bacterium]
MKRSTSSDSVASAANDGLRYVSDHDPGLRRVKRGKGFRYVGVGGRVISNAAELDAVAGVLGDTCVVC